MLKQTTTLFKYVFLYVVFVLIDLYSFELNARGPDLIASAFQPALPFASFNSLDEGNKNPVDVILQHKQRALVVIDPGHGGKDLGTHSLKTPKYQEKHLTLSTARLVKNYLEQLGHTVILTRNSDMFISLQERAAIANRKKSHLFVSIHFNSAKNREAEGIEIFYYRSREDQERSHQSKTLAETLLSRVLRNTHANSRGVKYGNLAVIRETEMPAVLVEGGFLTNHDEAKKIKTGSYLKQLAWGIAQGIDDYVTTKT